MVHQVYCTIFFVRCCLWFPCVEEYSCWVGFALVSQLSFIKFVHNLDNMSSIAVIILDVSMSLPDAFMVTRSSITFWIYDLNILLFLINFYLNWFVVIILQYTFSHLDLISFYQRANFHFSFLMQLLLCFLVSWPVTFCTFLRIALCSFFDSSSFTTLHFKSTVGSWLLDIHCLFISFPFQVSLIYPWYSKAISMYTASLVA